MVRYNTSYRIVVYSTGTINSVSTYIPYLYTGMNCKFIRVDTIILWCHTSGRFPQSNERCCSRKSKKWVSGVIKNWIVNISKMEFESIFIHIRTHERPLMWYYWENRRIWSKNENDSTYSIQYYIYIRLYLLIVFSIFSFYLRDF